MSQIPIFYLGIKLYLHFWGGNDKKSRGRFICNECSPKRFSVYDEKSL